MNGSRLLCAIALIVAASTAAGCGPGDADGGTDSGTDSMVCTGAASAARAVASPADLVGGAMATGLVGTGDVLLENDHIRVIIQGPGRNVAINPYGGSIIDADIKRGGEPGQDILGEVGPLVNIVGTSTADTVEVLEPGGVCTPAVVRATGTYALSDYINPNTIIPASVPGVTLAPLDLSWPLRVQIDYSLAPDDTHVVMTTTLSNTSATETVPVAMGYLVHGGRGDAFLSDGDGFFLPSFGDFDYLRIVGEDSAYALLPIAKTSIRLLIGIAGGFAMAHDGTALDVVAFPGSAPAVLDPGASISYETWFIVGRTLSDVEAVARRGLEEPECVPVRVRVEEESSGTRLAGVDVTAIDLNPAGTETAAYTHGRTLSDGTVSLCLRADESAALIAGQPGRPYDGGGTDPARTVVDVGAEASPGIDPDVTLTLPATGRVNVTVTATDGSSLPVRVAVLGVDPSPHTNLLRGDGYDPMAPGVVYQGDSVDGTFDFPLEPGDYDVVVTRGPEYALLTIPITVTAGATETVTGTLHRVLDTTGWLSGDFHVHAQMSPDATVLLSDRVSNAAAENVEVIVATDQAFVTDYEPVIGDIGVEPYLAAFPGEEVATPDYGHFNVFPMVPDPALHNRGANDWPGLDVAGIVGLRTNLAPGTPGIVQINHPRAIPAPGLANYFIQIDLQFDAAGPSVGPMAIATDLVRLASDAELLSLGFDTMEVMTWVNVQGLSDWFNFLNAGVVFTATGNSDTHTVHVESTGWPRNFVSMAVDDPATLDAAAFLDAVRAGATTVSFGPFLVATVREPAGPEVGMGEMLNASVTGLVEVVARLQAADWVDVDRIDVYENGTLIHTEMVAPALVPVGTTGEMRFEHELVVPVVPVADAWYVVVGSGTTPMYPALPYNESDPATLTLADIRAGNVLGPVTPFAVTNPVWVDVDGDGAVTPSFVVLPEDWQSYRAEDRTNPY